MTTESAPPERPILATHLHLRDQDAFHPAFTVDSSLPGIEVEHPLFPFSRFLYSTADSGFSRVDRLRCPDDTDDG